MELKQTLKIAFLGMTLTEFPKQDDNINEYITSPCRKLHLMKAVSKLNWGARI